MKIERQTPQKAPQCPLPRRGSRYNGAWTSATSPGRGEADFIPFNPICCAQKAANEHPAPSESSIPLSKSSYQIGLKTASKGLGRLLPGRHPAGHLAMIPAATSPSQQRQWGQVNCLCLHLGSLPLPHARSPRMDLKSP